MKGQAVGKGIGKGKWKGKGKGKSKPSTLTYLTLNSYCRGTSALLT